MAELHVCDICGEVLKTEVHIIAFSKFNYPDDAKNIHNEPMSVDEFFDELANLQYQAPKKPKVKEICPECWKILDKFFKMRIEEINKIKRELKHLEKKLKESEDK